MRKLIYFIALALFLCGGTLVFALDTSDAIFTGVIRITNNSTANTNLSVPFTANSTVYINAGYMETSGNNTAITSSSGAEVAYMPGFAGNAWVIDVPSIGTNSIQNDTLFMGGTTDMEGKIRYFPAAGGMTVVDDATLEPGDNCTFSISGYINTIAGVTKNLLVKEEAFKIHISSSVSGNITADILHFSTSAPTIAATNNSKEDGDVTTHNVSLPSNISNGDLLIVLFNHGTGAGSITTPTGWTEMTNTLFVSGRYAVYYKIADGTEGATVDITTSNVGHSAHIAYRITNYSGVPEIGSPATDTDDSPDPPNLTPSWGSATNLWLVIEGDNAGRTINSYPSNYSNGINIIASSGPAAGSAQRALLASSENPGVFTLNAAGAWISNTIAIAPEYVPEFSVSAIGISSGVHSVVVTANTTTLSISIDGNLEDSTAISSGVPDTSTNWTFFQNNVMPYVETANVTANGSLVGSWSWEYATTFTDASGNGNNGTPTFRNISSDADVSAELISFSPITEARAPAFTVNITTAGWITADDTQSGNFTTTTNSSYPGSIVISDVTTAGAVPVQLLELILAGFILLSFSFYISWIMRTNREGSLFVKILAITAGLGIMVAVSIIDSWMLYLFLMISIAISMGASQRTFTGTGNTGNNMIGFLAMAFVGMTTINRILEGRFIQSSDVSLLRNTLAFQPFEVFGLFTIPVPNTDFLLNGIPALLRWDYSFFGGNAQIFQYMLYSITTVVSFMLFVLVFGAIYQMFSRGR